ncbi:rRNA N6-adenosine-methyltransferase ZCCHC4 isoform X1 [Vespa crabro]|uniref:rRNA N6-adenosine-methyltransferase ZCCHC4 isoform X1 n=1 Tax=Vespa crabro TaxID=7445 RepID=UPI001F015178|nr:rRNA N6-adenosine-methyltransferase ZCCHC4 isoform X1 [Vespa crabro]
MEKTRNLECFWRDDKHPHCAHGPTVLFGKYIDGTLERFYVCSACRDRKLCRFYLKYGEKLTKLQQDIWEKEKKKIAQSYNHQKLFIRFNTLLATSPNNRSYCHDCEKLIFINERNKHNDHLTMVGLTDYQMHHPTEVLKPLENSKKEAQYLFSKKSVKDIINMLLELKAKQVICIGAPRIHEYISQNLEDKLSSLLLDIDGRFHNFLSPLSYGWYNLFNHYFFNENAQFVFEDFLTQNKGKDLYLICDPPFGGRVELISQTIKKISDLHKKLNKVEGNNDDLKIMFIFPYFMEFIMREKSNPPSVTGGLRDLKMLDYKVDYENHPLFKTDSTGRKYGSPIRIFTNIPLSLLKLPVSDGYKYCKKCQKWVSSENKHCKKCKDCTSKDGRRYKHCNLCERCVKPSWKHCNICKRCLLEKHKCNNKPKISGCCFKCKKLGHTNKNCEASNDKPIEKLENFGKRKINVNEDSIVIKKKKKSTSTSINFNENSSELLIRKRKVKSKESLISEKTTDNKVANIKRRYVIRQQKLMTSYKFKSPILKRFNRLIKLRQTKLCATHVNNKIGKAKKKLVNRIKVEDISSI